MPATAWADIHVQIAGSQNNLWMVAWNDQSQAVQVAVKSRDKWTQKAGTWTQVADIAAQDQRLHAFFTRGGYQWYDTLLLGGQPGDWPLQWVGRPIYASCAGQAPTPATMPAVAPGPRGTVVYLMLEVEEESAPPATQPASVPAAQPLPSDPAPAAETETTAPTTGPASARMPALVAATTPAGRVASSAGLVRRPVIFYHDGQNWRRLTEYAAGVSRGLRSYLMAVMPDGLYVVECDGGKPVRIARFDQGAWTDFPLPAWDASQGNARWLIANQQILLLAGTIEAKNQQSVFLRRFDGRGLAQPVVIQKDGNPLLLQARGPVDLTRYGSDLAMVWRDNGNWRIASVTVDGRVTEVKPLDILVIPSSPSMLVTLFQWVPITLAVVMLLVLFLRQRENVTRPFTLPPQLVPSQWVKRIAAFILDSMPFAMTATMIVFPSSKSTDEILAMLEQARQGADVKELIIATSLWMGMYVIYAIIMEHFFAATVGKMLFQMRVVGEGGQRAKLGAIVIRNVTKIIELFAKFFTILFLLWPLFSRYRQRMGDIIARTAVVDRRPQTESLIPGPPPERPADPPAPPRDADK